MERENETGMPSYRSSNICYDLYVKRKWAELKSFYEENRIDAFLPQTDSKETALHLAVYSKDIDLVRSLCEIVYKDASFPGFDVSKCTKFGNTPLHEAASLGNVEIVKILMEYKPDLLRVKNKRGETPFFVAAIDGHTKVIKYLAETIDEELLRSGKSKEQTMNHHVRSDTSSMLHEAIRGYYFETALELVKNPNSYHIETDWEDSDGMTAFQLLANIPFAFESGHSFGGILEYLIYRGFPMVQIIGKKYANTANKKTYNTVMELTNILAEKDKSWMRETPLLAAARDGTTDGKRGTPLLAAARDGTTDGKHETPLIAASRNGIAEIVKAILDRFPQAIEHENHNGENIFHVAVENRRKNVLNVLKSYHFKQTRLIWKFNKDGDTILHKAAYMSEHYSRRRAGDALRLQSDIQWFQRVKKMMPPHHVNHLNKKKLTPQALFTKEHHEMVENGKAWLIRTTNSCIIVAVLIATVAFTSIYTVPGGSDKKTGKPVLLKTTAFTAFTAFDVCSLGFAFTSVVVFLSITSSKMNEKDFRMSLPIKLVVGLSMLFWSVATLMFGFAATVIIMIRHRVHAAAVPIIAIACFPVAFFLLLQLPLYANITWFSTKDLLRSLADHVPQRKPPRDRRT